MDSERFRREEGAEDEGATEDEGAVARDSVFAAFDSVFAAEDEGAVAFDSVFAAPSPRRPPAAV